eukprot:4722728-Pleurochrysis_carterae.AAC.2
MNTPTRERAAEARKEGKARREREAQEARVGSAEAGAGRSSSRRNGSVGSSSSGSGRQSARTAPPASRVDCPFLLSRW